jgi:hypothetical protein
MSRNPIITTAQFHARAVPQLGRRQLASPIVGFNAPFHFILTTLLAIANIAVCSFGAAGWILMVQNSPSGNLAFVVNCFFAGLVFTGVIGLAGQVGLLEDVK